VSGPSGLPDDRSTLLEALVRLEAAKLTSDEWDRVDSAVRELRGATGSGNRQRRLASTTTLVNLGFGAQVRQRLDHPRQQAPVVAPTKPSRALPIVGSLCACLLLALGWALGGGVVLIGTALFAVLILVVAITGTTGFAARRAETGSRLGDEVATPPPELAAAMAELRRELTTRGRGS
jgi:hypothetical protein